MTPNRPALDPGSAGINTVDVIAIQRHYLDLGTPLSGCPLAAADVNGVGGVNTVDVIAVQRFFLGLTTGIANTGTYRFVPASRSYPGIVSDQTGENYDALIFGDVTNAFVHRPENMNARQGTVAKVMLPHVTLARSPKNFTAPVKTTTVDSTNKLVGFQGDFTFDERVVTFQRQPVGKAGITAGNWNVSGNVLPGPGPIRTLRVSAYSNDFTPLSGSGALFELRLARVRKSAEGTPLLWSAPPNQFIFIDADLSIQEAGSAAPGRVSSSGKRK